MRLRRVNTRRLLTGIIAEMPCKNTTCALLRVNVNELRMREGDETGEHVTDCNSSPSSASRNNDGMVAKEGAPHLSESPISTPDVYIICITMNEAAVESGGGWIDVGSLALRL